MTRKKEKAFSAENANLRQANYIITFQRKGKNNSQWFYQDHIIPADMTALIKLCCTTGEKLLKMLKPLKINFQI